MLPLKVAKMINVAIGANRLMLGQFWLDCAKRSNLPNIDFTIGSRNFTITPNDYISSSDDGRDCMSNFGASLDPRSKVILLGNLFLQKFYTIFDCESSRIGFADYAK